MPKILRPHADRAYALLRIVSGLMFAFHGAQKILGVLSDVRPPVGTQVWFAGLIELGAGAAIALGIFTSWAAFLASGTMAVAYFQVHWRFQGGPQFFPTINKGELAALYCFVFLFIACKGAGPWSVEARRAEREKSP